MTEYAENVRSGAKRMTTFGFIAMFLGLLAMMTPLATGLSIALLVGVLVIVAGVVRMLWAFRADSPGRGLLVFAIGALTLLAGVALVSNPLFTSGVLTILLTAYLLIDGLFEISMGLQARPRPGSGWLLFAGVVSILLGGMIWSQFPLSGAWAIGILLGIKLLFVGLIMVTAGSALRA